MKILYITSDPLEYWTSANIRNLNLIEGLLSCGHQVTTLSTEVGLNSLGKSNNVPRECKRYFIPLNKLHSIMTQKKTDNSNLINKFISALKESLYILKKYFTIYDARKMEVSNLKMINVVEHYDVMISSSDPKSSHLYAERLKRLYPNIADKWVQYWGDPFTGDISKGFIGLHSSLAKEELRLLQLCDLAVYVSPLTANYICDKYRKNDIERKIYFTPIAYSHPKLYRAKSNKPYLIGYFGDYSKRNRNIFPLYNAMARLGGKALLKVIGTSDVSLAQTNNVQVFKRMPAIELQQVEKDTNLRICICNRNGTQIPGKIYHAGATDTPTLIILDGDCASEIRKYFEQFNRYYFCENNEQSIYDAINKISDYNLNTTISSMPVSDFNAICVVQNIIKRLGY